MAIYAIPLIRLPNNFFADDSYFYFQVAWNIVRSQASIFNNIIPTNAFHPLWMLCCVAVYKLVPAKLAALHAIAALITLLDVLRTSRTASPTSPAYRWLRWMAGWAGTATLARTRPELSLTH